MIENPEDRRAYDLETLGGQSLHERSHGEAFLALVLHRLRGNGLYLFDEPEAALSPMRQLALLAAIGQLVEKGSQFIIATHSPLLLAYPEATIYTRAFLEHPERMLRELMTAETDVRESEA